jgi:hypothetical protein
MKKLRSKYQTTAPSRPQKILETSSIEKVSIPQNQIGHVYVLVSPKSEYVKIGGTDYPPVKRIREVNISEPYKSLGPWSLADFRQVTNWRKIETFLHYTFRSKLIKHVDGQKELFHVTVQEASAKLNEIDPANILKKPKIDRMFQDEDFSGYILKLFTFAGLMNWLDIQGAWTFVLFPMTGKGRYFTINIGPHEVAFSNLPRKNEKPTHMILMDQLVLDFPTVSEWVCAHNGQIKKDVYTTAMPRSTSILFDGTFVDVLHFLKLDGVRRALIAYWSEGLIGLKERGVSSSYAKYHNWNAVAEIRSRLLGGRAI